MKDFDIEKKRHPIIDAIRKVPSNKLKFERILKFEVNNGSNKKNNRKEISSKKEFL